MIEMFTFDWVFFSNIMQIIFADIILSGDNALVIGMAAAGLAATQRKRAIFFGMVMASILRIIFAIIASWLIAIQGILLVGGVLLCWVCWRFYKDLKTFNTQDHREHRDDEPDLARGEGLHQRLTPREDSGGSELAPEKRRSKSFGRAMFTILIADVSMSLDNVIAVAAIARENTAMLVFGLIVAIAIMALCASLVMKIMVRYKWLSYIGLFFLIYLTGAMIFDGVTDLTTGWGQI